MSIRASAAGVLSLADGEGALPGHAEGLPDLLPRVAGGAGVCDGLVTVGGGALGFPGEGGESAGGLAEAWNTVHTNKEGAPMRPAALTRHQETPLMATTDTTIAAHLLPTIREWESEHRGDPDADLWNDLLYGHPMVDQEASPEDNTAIVCADGSRLKVQAGEWVEAA